MRVLDLSQPEDFRQASVDLWEQVKRDYQCDLVVAIAKGGVEVMRQMGLPDAIPRTVVRCQRPSSRWKGIFRPFLRVLPTGLNNLLRLGESWLRGIRHGSASAAPAQPIRDLYYRNDFKSKVNQASRILVVDDAVDSGGTAWTVRRALAKLNSSATIRLAVLTITMKWPLVLPDYTLYQQTLIRFPWSHDA